KKKKGEALLLYGTQRAFIKIELDKEEIRLWNNDLYEKTYNESASIEPNYVEQLGLSDIDLAELEEELRQYEMIYE
ncbi:TPA: type VI secretion protein, partial [Staphylococcus aureus]|nr:type VI secretion protein [Staphylococcus aureus]HCV0262844.1 type VI secretion protein [Staphylococcus aureus]HCV6821373.1 type VI secretion protein [Staphylococcus aureus]